MTTDFDAFDRRLADAFRAYAADAPTVDPAAFARSIAREHPRRRSWTAQLRRPAARRLVLVVLAVLLLLAALAAIASIGAPRLPIRPAVAIPDELYGEWRATVGAAGSQLPAGEYTLNLSESTLVRAPAGNDLSWAGTASALVAADPDSEDLLISAPPPCGDARYAITSVGQDVETSPGPSASGGNPTPFPGLTLLERIAVGESFRLVPVSESCVERRHILASSPWIHPSLVLQSGETYQSMDFTEPFSFVMPGNANSVETSARFWGKGVFVLGNGFDWRGFFLDDMPLGADICHPERGRLADIPATPGAVEAWLRSSSGLRVGDPVELTVDGRTALSIPIDPIDCHEWDPPLIPGEFYLGTRVYAIPTDDDLILFTATSFGLDEIGPIADDLVRSMTFQ
jgi:hypothetical protein